MKEILLTGIDVGSTTTKIAAINPENGKVVYSDYRRHQAAQVHSVYDALRRLEKAFPHTKIRLVLTGSGAKLLSERLHVPFIQEVVANSMALREQYHHVRTAIELGGQDAKMIFFKEDENTGLLNVTDMRMNGSCAGGTGAFIDEIASILQVPVEEFNALAAKGTCVYDISGRCGVYAKTDIQPLLNQGIAREDLALSAFHAIAKQTIGGLAQGLDIEKPVIFEGGPLTFNPTLIRVFEERLGLKEEETLIPEHPELMVAYGAALSLEELFTDEGEAREIPKLMKQLLLEEQSEQGEVSDSAKPFFASEKEKLAFVGDGINDAPVLSRADIGIAMGALGSDAAIEAADIVLMDDDPLKISKAIKIARKCIHIVYENIYFAIGIKILCLILGALGIANMWMAIFADVGVMIIAVLNAIRTLFVKNL